MSKGFDIDSLEVNLLNTHYFIEGDSFVQYAIWTMYVDRPYKGSEPLDYEQISNGFWKQIDETNNMSFSFARINGKLICFYSISSLKVDWEKVEKWMAKYWTDQKTGQRRKCNPMNFGHCVNACRE